MTLEDSVRYLGLLLQVLGLGTTALGIADVRRRFTDRPGVMAVARARARQAGRWLGGRLRALLRRPRSARVVGGSGRATAHASVRARGRLAYGELPADMRVEERLAVLDRRTRDTRDMVNRLDIRLHDETERLAAADCAEAAERERADNELRGLVRELAGGGLRLQTWGVVAFLVGEVLAGINEELARLLRWLV